VKETLDSIDARGVWYEVNRSNFKTSNSRRDKERFGGKETTGFDSKGREEGYVRWAERVRDYFSNFKDRFQLILVAE
jgi:hypothetical protein